MRAGLAARCRRRGPRRSSSSSACGLAAAQPIDRGIGRDPVEHGERRCAVEASSAPRGSARTSPGPGRGPHRDSRRCSRHRRCSAGAWLVGTAPRSHVWTPERLSCNPARRTAAPPIGKLVVYQSQPKCKTGQHLLDELARRRLLNVISARPSSVVKPDVADVLPADLDARMLRPRSRRRCRTSRSRSSSPSRRLPVSRASSPTGGRRAPTNGLQRDANGAIVEAGVEARGREVDARSAVNSMRFSIARRR